MINTIIIPFFQLRKPKQRKTNNPQWADRWANSRLHLVPEPAFPTYTPVVLILDM